MSIFLTGPQCGPVLGPVLGGALAEANWRWIFGFLGALAPNSPCLPTPARLTLQSRTSHLRVCPMARHSLRTPRNTPRPRGKRRYLREPWFLLLATSVVVSSSSLLGARPATPDPYSQRVLETVCVRPYRHRYHKHCPSLLHILCYRGPTPNRTGSTISLVACRSRRRFSCCGCRHDRRISLWRTLLRLAPVNCCKDGTRWEGRSRVSTCRPDLGCIGVRGRMRHVWVADPVLMPSGGRPIRDLFE